MGTYDSGVSPVRQDNPWSCSCASATFMLHSIGIEESYHDLENALVAAGLVSPQDGLEVGSGGPLADWLSATFGVQAHADPWIEWDWLQEHAGTCPIAIGSSSLYHWVAVRGVDGDGNLTLANPAPGYRGLGDTMTEAQFAQWAPWACVYIDVDAGEEAEDVGKIEELESLVGVLRDAGRVARENIEEALAVPRLPKAARTALEAGALPAAQTVERGGE